jgi:hypothetical protein
LEQFLRAQQSFQRAPGQMPREVIAPNRNIFTAVKIHEQLLR